MNKIVRRAIVSSLAIALATGSAIAQFTEISAPALNIPGFTNGIAWGDYDADGDLDLFAVYSVGQADHLFRNDGAAGWTDVTSAPLGSTGDGAGAVWGDYDNDGSLDLVLTNPGEGNRLYRNEGAGAFSNVASAAINQSGPWLGVAWADQDRDGDLDLYVVNANGVGLLLRNDGASGFVDATPSGMIVSGLGQGCAWADYDNDGDPDLVVAGIDRVRLFRNDGSGSFTNLASPPLALASHCDSPTWGDFDNDGDLDLFVGATDGFASHLFRNDGPAGFVDASSAPVQGKGRTQGAGWADYDNDGDLDLFLADAATGNTLARNDGGGSFFDATSPALTGLGNCTGTAWGDYDNDGDPDLFVATWLDLPDHLLRNDNANGNGWLEIALRGSVSNRAGIGARVRVIAGGRTQIREISGGSGYFSQDALRALFGLGAASQIDLVEIRWPSGILQALTDVQPNQLITIVEPSSSFGLPQLFVTREGLTWTGGGPTASFDVLRGNLASLVASGGDFGQASPECLAQGLADHSLPYVAVPPSEDGFWFLVRASFLGGKGTYDSGASRQVFLRDQTIRASGADCP